MSKRKTEKNVYVGEATYKILSHLLVHGPTRRRDLLAMIQPKPGVNDNWGNLFFQMSSTFGENEVKRTSLIMRKLIEPMKQGHQRFFWNHDLWHLVAYELYHRASLGTSRS